jgi:tRNA/rRNA methyltransferase
VLPSGVSVTLVEPQGPVNVGHVARLVRNFGVEKLYLVKPRVDMSVAAVYASHASDVLDDAVVTTFAKVRKENDLLVGTSAVRARSGSNVVRRGVSPARLHDLLSSARSSSLVFGRDTTGLTKEEIGICDVMTTIETSPKYRALNIANAAAIVLYLASRGRGSGLGEQSRTARQIFAKSLAELGGLSGSPQHRVRNFEAVGTRLVTSSNLTDTQLNFLTGVLRRASARIESLQERDSKT